MTENLADAVIEPTFEQIIAGIKHSGVREILTHAQENEQRLNRELEYLEADEDLNDEAKERRAEDVIACFGPKISEAYTKAREKLEVSVENSRRFSLPFPEGKTYAQARVQDTSEMLAVQGESEAIAQRIAGKSLQEATQAASKLPGDKGIRDGSNRTVDGLRKEFDKAMALGGIEGRIRALAVERVAERMGIGLDQVVDHHRKDVHYRALEDARRSEQALFAVPSGKKPPQNPFSAKRKGQRYLGAYRSGNKVLTGGGTKPLFPKRNRRAWK